MRSKIAMLVLAAMMILGLATAATAGNFTWNVTGPSEVQQGKSIDITINVAADGALNNGLNNNGAKPDPAFTVATQYVIGDGNSVPQTMGTPPFTRTLQYFTSGPKAGQQKDTDLVGGNTSATLTLSAPLTLAAGLYTVTITPTASNGMTLTPTSFDYQVTVTPAAIKPILTINSPANGNKFLYGSIIPISVTVDQQVDVVLAQLDGGTFFPLDFDVNGECWTGTLAGLALGSHIFTAEATNSAGTGSATSTFSVYVNFGAWLPPIAISSKQMKAGSTLPVKFTILGANGPVDDSVAKPHVFLNGVDMGQAASLLDTTTGLPYFQLNVKLPAAGPHTVGVSELNSVPPISTSWPITTK